MADPTTAAAAASQLPPVWALVLPWVLTAFGGAASIIAGAFAAMYRSKENTQQKLVDALKAQALSSESARIASDKARADAERREERLKGEFKATVEALGHSVRRDEAHRFGAALSVAPDADDPTIRFYVKADQYRDAVERREQEERDRDRSIGNEVSLRHPPPSEALALEAFGAAHGPGPRDKVGGPKDGLPLGAGGEDHRAWKRDQEQRGIQTPTQALPPYRGRQDTKGRKQ